MYEFVDNDVQNRTTYSYMLEDVDFNGIAMQHGPVIATPRLIYAIGQFIRIGPGRFRDLQFHCFPFVSVPAIPFRG
jgi:hypothetical protein